MPRADASIRPYNSKIVAQTTHKTLQFWYNIKSRAKYARRSIH